MSETPGVRIYDQDADTIRSDEPAFFTVWTPTGLRMLRLRIGRGTLADLRETQGVRESER